ncbi:unnamed protein product [Phytophthora fragariaefolia]|uniref:Unnamed protein product n=1 Tax=Phytophthora fragariaefolia TaxID=1490495 RepID=A0A9W6Y3A1_9STRA|nr:unnamed protein product [Phytophthora fragariaefolia]
MADVDRLLLLIESELPLGRDEWERLATSFNANRPRGAPKRDFESLRRKFKVLYRKRKPTGMPNMPPHIKKAKDVKQAIDDKANVVEMDDVAVEDRSIEPDFSFEAEPDDSFYVYGDGNSDGDGDGVQLSKNERKAEERRVEEEKRRREEIAAREARYLADKADAAERRHQEKLERVERARRERDGSRARMQGLVMLINAIKKNA